MRTNARSAAARSAAARSAAARMKRFAMYIALGLLLWMGWLVHQIIYRLLMVILPSI